MYSCFTLDEAWGWLTRTEAHGLTLPRAPGCLRERRSSPPTAGGLPPHNAISTYQPIQTTSGRPQTLPPADLNRRIDHSSPSTFITTHGCKRESKPRCLTGRTLVPHNPPFVEKTEKRGETLGAFSSSPNWQLYLPPKTEREREIDRAHEGVKAGEDCGKGEAQSEAQCGTKSGPLLGPFRLQAFKRRGERLI